MVFIKFPLFADLDLREGLFSRDVPYFVAFAEKWKDDGNQHLVKTKGFFPWRKRTPMF